MRSFPKLSLAALACSILVSGCGPEVGDECQPNQGACVDDGTELACQDGKFIATPCRGPEGCKEEGAVVTCDISGNRAGDPCSTDDEGQGACATEGRKMVRCEGGEYAVIDCRGPDGCQQQGPTQAMCDLTVAAPGDPCEEERSACSVDGQSLLTCKEGQMQVTRMCRGEDHCQVQGRTIDCDTSVAQVGDVCDEDFGSACSADGQSMLHCVDGSIAVQAACRGEDGCSVSGSSVRCDASKAEVGDPCTGGAACSTDGKAVLTCEDGTFAQDRECGECVISGSRIRCEEGEEEDA